MATNEVFSPTGTLSLPVPNGTASGDPLVLFGRIPCVALTDEGEGGNADNYATVALNPAWVFDISVKGENDLGDAGIAVGDAVYRDSDGEFNVDAVNGTLFGIALEVVTSGATDTIRVLLAPVAASEWVS